MLQVERGTELAAQRAERQASHGSADRRQKCSKHAGRLGRLMDKDHTKWSFDIITDLIEGPLLNPKRLEETIKATKFIRRLFSFFLTVQ